MGKRCIYILQILFLLFINISVVHASVNIEPKEIYLGVNYSQNLLLNTSNTNSIRWNTSNPNIVTVEDGRITGRGVGTAYVSVTDGIETDVCKVNVILVYVPVTSISLTETSTTLLVNNTKKIDVTINPAYASNSNIIYTSDSPNIATVDKNGKVTAKKAGTAYISIRLEDKTATYKVTVIDKITLNSISVTKNINIKVGATSKINVTYNPTNATNKNVTFKSNNPNIVTVDASGNVRGVSAGTTNIITTSADGGHSATTKVTVTSNTSSNINLQSISLNKTQISLNPNGTEKLTVNYNPSNATNKSVTWKSSDESVATVDGNGLVKAVSIGTAVITATSNNNLTASCNVNVTNETVEDTKLNSISLNRTSLTLNVSGISKLNVRFSPTTATNKNVTWTSNDANIATVDNEGNIKAVSEGTVTITATSQEGGYTASCEVIVTNITSELKGITLSKRRITLKTGNSANLEVIYEPTNATNQEVTFISSDESIATVDNEGKVTAVGIGKASIKVTSTEGTYSAICQVSVISNEPIEAIEFEKKRITAYVGDTFDLETISTPENTGIENPIWTSSNESIATVVDGTVTGIKVGIATITISNSDGTIKAEAAVNIINKEAEKLNITIDGYDLKFDPNVKNYTLTIGNEKKLNINTNIDSSKVVINGNQDLKNGSIITITINKKDKYIINIKTKNNYTIYIIAAASVLLIVNLIRILVKAKKKKKNQ